MELSTRNTIFSTNSAGAPGATLTLRKQPGLDLDHALSWVDAAGQTWHLLPTRMDSKDRVYAQITAAMVQTVTVHQREDDTTQPLTCPAVVGERYVRHEQQWPMSVNDFRLLLTVPKPVRLRTGALVEVGTALYEIVLPHEEGLHHNQYEVERREDL